MGKLLARIDSWQRGHHWVALPFAVNKRFGEHNGTQLAATISYYSFFSVFPLLLVFVTILGIVLEGNPTLRQDLLDSALAQVPLLGDELTGPTALEGNVLALVIGLATAIWAGMGAVTALQHGLDVLADTPVYARPNFAIKRLKAIAFLLAFAVGLALGVLLTNLATIFDLGPITAGVGVLATALVNGLLVLSMFALLPAHRRPWREAVPGIVTAAILLVALQLLASFVVRRFIAGASDTYGTFAAVIALLSWFHLVSRILMMSAQLNEVLASRLWPRSLVAGAEPTEGDRRAVLLDVHGVQRDQRMGYAASVGDDVATDTDPLGEAEHVRP